MNISVEFICMLLGISICLAGISNCIQRNEIDDLQERIEIIEQKYEVNNHE